MTALLLLGAQRLFGTEEYLAIFLMLIAFEILKNLELTNYPELWQID